MRVLSIGRCAFSFVAAALLAGCGGSQPPIGAPGAMPRTSALAARANSANYKVLYSFGAESDDGRYPEATLIDVGGTLYGTTAGGGTNGEGTVFTITPGGTEKVLYSFGKSPDGANPEAGLLDVDGTLYGTTSQGGSDGGCSYPYYSSVSCGTVFSITTSGKEKVLHSFRYSDDGWFPLASLIELKGTLYGTTSQGGYDFPCGYALGYASCGTVFSITPSGKEKVLNNFNGSDGAVPVASLVKVKGTFYGTTSGGGSDFSCYSSNHGCGTVFSITPNGSEKVLHSFGGGADGYDPEASLIEVKGTFYGTTLVGPSRCDGVEECGTVFSITPSGAEKVLHAFRGGTDGAGPFAPLINVKGRLYGTTGYGGPYTCQNGGSCGTIFSITPSGTEKVLHSFGKNPDGNGPTAGFIDVGGTLYGTTQIGGTYGRGTVVSLTP